MVDEAQTSQPGFWDKWWPRIRREPMAVCLLLALVFIGRQEQQRGLEREQHRSDARELRQEAAMERAKKELAESERDKAQAKTIESQQLLIERLHGGKADSSR